METCAIEKLLRMEVRQRREKLGFSQEQLAERASLHRTYVSDIERGTRNSSLKSIEKVSGALGISIGTLFSKFTEVPGAKPYADANPVEVGRI